MDQLRWKRESRSARVTRPGECARARAAVAATAQVKVHWRKRELTMTRVLTVYIETNAKIKKVKKPLMQNALWQKYKRSMANA